MKDFGIGAIMEKTDWPKWLKFVGKINMLSEYNRRHNLIHSFELSNRLFSCVQKRWDDHVNATLEVSPGQQIYFPQALRTEDLPVDAGLVEVCNLILRINTVMWRYIEAGTGGASIPNKAQTALTTAISGRLDSTLLGGWREYSGISFRIGAIAGEDHAFQNVTEMGVFVTSSGAPMLNRMVFSGTGLTVSRNASTFDGATYTAVGILAVAIELIPLGSVPG